MGYCSPGTTLTELKKVTKADWKDLKTEIFDFDSRFIWLDDNAFESEKRILNKYKRIDVLIVVDLNRKNELREVKMKIMQMASNSSYKK